MSEERQEINWINAAPDSGYIFRILESYIDDSYFSDNLAGLPPENPLCIEMNKAREARNKLLREAIKILEGNSGKDALLSRCKKGMEAVKSLIEESTGVFGLHRNGDLAPWEELRTGGEFEDWLKDFDTAFAKLTEAGIK